MEQDHRSIKQRYYLMLGFGAVESAGRFCQAYDEVRNYFRARRRMGEVVSLAERRQQYQTRVEVLQTMLRAA